uniref:Uncharacterized protein n=1 Tax=Rhizophora mucronata TaxID=61149 RepID=A0A2P2P1J1_RHIMU
MIRPLCQARKLEEARNILATMTEENLSPTTETYHAFLKGETSFEATLEVLDQMKIAGLGPAEDTFLLVLAKVFQLEQAENALMVWSQMKHHGVKPEMTHYTMLVEGLARCGLSSKAAEYYAEMRSHGFPDDPKLLRILNQPVHDKLGHQKLLVKQVKNDRHAVHEEGRMSKQNSPHGGSKERRHFSNSLNRKYKRGKRSQERSTMKLRGRERDER